MSDKQISKNKVKIEFKGTVKWFNYKKAYGFITRDETNDDIFVHKKSLCRSHYWPYKHISIRKGDNVEFSIKTSEKGNEALSVRKIRNTQENKKPENDKKLANVSTKKKKNSNNSGLLRQSELLLLNMVKNLSLKSIEKLDTTKTKQTINAKNNLKIHRLNLNRNTNNYNHLQEMFENMYLKHGVRVLGVFIEKDTREQKLSNDVKVSIKVVTTRRLNTCNKEVKNNINNKKNVSNENVSIVTLAS